MGLQAQAAALFRAGHNYVRFQGELYRIDEHGHLWDTDETCSPSEGSQEEDLW